MRASFLGGGRNLGFCPSFPGPRPFNFCHVAGSVKARG